MNSIKTSEGLDALEPSTWGYTNHTRTHCSRSQYEEEHGAHPLQEVPARRDARRLPNTVSPSKPELCANIGVHSGTWHRTGSATKTPLHLRSPSKLPRRMSLTCSETERLIY
ncbi:hypothetical protein KIN20_014988 [Parelaphostrongylus tenuis]|uniref:Uncharacterized protein n=1 Tax=Parelaphostrongylus tenuis TaxID=148309 RepID=A0AAD5MXX1_PARTN|nr:hypothetical protein KIN20_014988 [Parelaphostrongylus tenuis]